MSRLKIAFPYLLVAAMAGMVIWSNLRQASVPDDTLPGEQLVDPVCHMQINPNWAHTHTHASRTFHFCSTYCTQKFAADPGAYLTERCVVCSATIDPAAAVTATYLGKSYRLDSQTCRDRFKADPASFFMHTMWGIPPWLYYVSIAAVLVVSFVMFERSRWRGRAPGHGAAAGNDGAVSLAVVPPPRPAEPRIDLMRWSAVGRLLRSRPLRALLQLIMAGAFALIIAAGLWGNQNPALNIAPLLTWTIWWCGLVVLIMFFGKAWCYMCPWDAIATWAERLRFWKKTDRGTGLAMRWPHLLRNIWLATVLFITLTWIEIGFGVTTRPAATAWLAIAMLLLTLVCAFLFDRKSFCRYGCLVGRVSGLYAMFAGIEVRKRHDHVCRACHTKECVKGSATAYACPTFENPAKMALNTYCIQCTECLQSCPHDNMTVNLRPWGADLIAPTKPRADEAYLALLMLAISSFHGLTMTPLWRQMTDAVESALGVGRVASFTLAMTALLAAPVLVYAALVYLSHRLATRQISVSASSSSSAAPSYREYFIRYAYCVLPIALFYHLAHNLEHLLMEGPKVVALASDPWGSGANLLGTAGWRIGPMVSLDVLWLLQVLLVGVGHVYSLWAANRISRRTFADAPAASRSQWPMLIGMIAFSIFSLWLLKQPMEMRTSAM